MFWLVDNIALVILEIDVVWKSDLVNEHGALFVVGGQYYAPSNPALLGTPYF